MALFLSFAYVMCFFISVYILIRVSEKCQNILFCFSKEERFRTFIGMVYHLYFLFQNSHLLTTILSYKKFASITESFILYFRCHFRCHFDCHFWVSFWIFCPPFYVSYPLFLSTFGVFWRLYWVSVHHLHNIAYLFIV